MASESSFIITLSMFEPLAGGKGKFSSARAVFQPTDTLHDVMQWAKKYARESEQEIVKVEVSENSR